MTNEETALADKILKEATEAPADIRRGLIDQYDMLVRAACGRRSATEVWPSAVTATGIRATAE